MMHAVFFINSILLLFDRHICQQTSEAEELLSCLKESQVKLISRGSPSYKEFNSNYNNRIIINPKGFLVPTNERDVQTLVGCGRKMQLKLTIKCGGQSFEEYSFGSDEHYVIDLRNINYVHIDKMNSVATVGAGIIAPQLLQQLIPHGFMLPIGNCFKVGISGFTLGGGYGFTVRSYGLMIQRVKQMKIVTENSKLITTNSKNEPDLFWALRGAGANNFGVVTKFKFNLLPLPKVITIVKFYSMDDFPNIFTLWEKWAESDPNDAITSSLYLNYPKPRGIMLFVVIKSATDAENENVLRSIRNIFPNITQSEVTYQSFNESLYTIGYELPNGFLKGSAFYVQRRLSDKDRQILINSAMQLCEVCYLLMDMYGGKVRENKNTAFNHNKPYFGVLFILGVPEEIGYNESIQLGNSLLPLVDKFLYETKRLDSGYSYQNYVDRNRTDWKKRYYGLIDYLKLRRIKTKYDKSNFFTCPQCIEPFKI